jgi:transglutaminase-like putative cysteine protease
VTATVAPPQPGRSRPAPPATPSPPRATPANAGGVANLALVLLTLSAVYGLARLFRRPLHFFVPVALVAVAVHCAAWACRRWGVTLPASAVACALVTVVTASWAALGHTTAYGIPWRGTYHALGPALQAAADAYRSTAAPTIVIPGFVVAGAVGAACVAFLSDWAAFRMRATTEAVLPSFSLFVLSAALAQGHAVVAAGALWLGALLVFLLVRQSAVESPTTAWFASRNRRGPTSVLALGGVMIVATVVLAVSIGPHLPGATGKPLVDWRHSSGGGGNGGRNTASPLVDMTARLKSLDQTEVFTVQTTQPTYLRITAMSTFNGSGWSLDDNYRPARGLLPPADTGQDALPPDSGPSETVQATIHVSGLDSVWLPVPYRPSRVTGVGGLSFSAAAGSIITDKPTSDGLVYTVVSQVPAPSTAALTASNWVGRSQPALQKYLSLSNVSPAIASLAEAHTQGAKGPFQAALMLQNWLRGPEFTYSLSVPQDQSANALYNFLTRTKAGFCQQFATAFAVLAREIGLPSRVAVGFTWGDVDSQGTYHVTDADAHAWPEVWFSGIGWVPFEPTPGRGSPDPSARNVTGAAPRQFEAGSTQPTTPGSPTTAPGTPTTAPSSHAGGALRPSFGAPSHGHGWAVPLLVAVASLAGAALLWAVGLALLGSAVTARRRRRARSPAEKVSLAWSLARESLERVGIPALAWETPAEYADRVAWAAGTPRAGGGVAREVGDGAGFLAPVGNGASSGRHWGAPPGGASGVDGEAGGPTEVDGEPPAGVVTLVRGERRREEPATSLPAEAVAAVAQLAALEERASYRVTGPGPGDAEAADAAAQTVARAARQARGRRRDFATAWDPRPVIAAVRAERAEATTTR